MVVVAAARTESGVELLEFGFWGQSRWGDAGTVSRILQGSSSSSSVCAAEDAAGLDQERVVRVRMMDGGRGSVEVNLPRCT